MNKEIEMKVRITNFDKFEELALKAKREGKPVVVDNGTRLNPEIFKDFKFETECY